MKEIVGVGVGGGRGKASHSEKLATSEVTISEEHDYITAETVTS